VLGCNSGVAHAALLPPTFPIDTGVCAATWQMRQMTLRGLIRAVSLYVVIHRNEGGEREQDMSRESEY